MQDITRIICLLKSDKPDMRIESEVVLLKVKRNFADYGVSDDATASGVFE